MGKKSTCFKIFFLPKQCIMKAVTEVLFMLVSSILVVYYRWCLEGEQEGRHRAILTFLSYSFLNSFKPLASATYCVNVLDSSIMSEYNNNNNNNKTNTFHFVSFKCQMEMSLDAIQFPSCEKRY